MAHECGVGKRRDMSPPTLEPPCAPVLGLDSHPGTEPDKHDAELGAVPSPIDHCTGELQAADLPHKGEAPFRGPGPGTPAKPTPSH